MSDFILIHFLGLNSFFFLQEGNHETCCYGDGYQGGSGAYAKHHVKLQ